MPATYDDANLVMQIVRWGTEMGLNEAVVAVLADDFDPEAAGSDDPSVRKVLNFGEVVGTFVKQGVLDRGLVTDLWWIEGLWSKVAPAALRSRAAHGEARLYENFEALASS
jgi:hypothetical protein